MVCKVFLRGEERNPIELGGVSSMSEVFTKKKLYSFFQDAIIVRVHPVASAWLQDVCAVVLTQ